jgi:hypothetical protein
VTNLMSMLSDPPTEPCTVPIGSVLDGKVSPIPSVASSSPNVAPAASQPTHGSPGSLALPAGVGNQDSVASRDSGAATEEIISAPTMLPVSGQPSPAGDSPAVRQLSVILQEPAIVAPVAVTLPTCSPVKQLVPSTTASPTIEDVIGQRKRLSTLTSVVVPAQPVEFPLPFSAVEEQPSQQEPAGAGVNTSLTDSIIEEMKDDGPAPLDVVTVRALDCPFLFRIS